MSEKRHYPTIKTAEICEQPECPEAMIWDMCSWMQTAKGGEDTDCHECPRWENDEHGIIQAGCFMLAHDACRVALAWKKRLEKSQWSLDGMGKLGENYWRAFYDGENFVPYVVGTTWLPTGIVTPPKDGRPYFESQESAISAVKAAIEKSETANG